MDEKGMFTIIKKILYLSFAAILLSSSILPSMGKASEHNGENLFVEEFMDEQGKNNRIVTEMLEDRNIVSLYIEGELEQQTTAYKETGEIVGFSDYGEKEFEKNVSDFVNISPELTPGEESGNVISPMGVGFYSQVASKKSVPNSSCSKTVTAYLYEKSSTVYSSKIIVSWSKGDVLTALVASIITVIIFKTPITATLLKEVLVGVGVSVVSGALYNGFKGSYQLRSEIKDYYATINGTKYFTNKITKEYYTLYNQYNGKQSTVYIGQHVSAYGKPTDYQVMLSQAIVNWYNATKCK